MVERLTLQAEPILMGHTLRQSLSGNRVSGSLVYVVPESPILALSKQIEDNGDLGDSCPPVISRTSRWLKDKHLGPGYLARRLTIVAQLVGTSTEGLGAIGAREFAAQKAKLLGL